MSGGCPLGFGSKKATGCPFGFGGGGRGAAEDAANIINEDALPEMDLGTLSHQKEGSHNLLSLKGIIYDVGCEEGSSKDGSIGGLLRPYIGHEVSRLLACTSNEISGDGIDVTLLDKVRKAGD